MRLARESLYSASENRGHLHAKIAAASSTTVDEFGERFFKAVVAKDLQDLTIPRRWRVSSQGHSGNPA